MPEQKLTPPESAQPMPSPSSTLGATVAGNPRGQDAAVGGMIDQGAHGLGGWAGTDDLASYSTYSAMAIVGFVFGVVALSAFNHPLLWVVPVIALLVNVLALKRISREAPRLIGRKAALLGLILSVTALIAAPARTATIRWAQRSQANALATRCFSHLQAREPHLAHRLTMPPSDQPPPDDSLWDRYSETLPLRRSLKGFVQKPAIRALLELGPDAQIRHYDTLPTVAVGSEARVADVYAVTYEEKGQKKSFFVEFAVVWSRSDTSGRIEPWVARLEMTTQPEPDSQPRTR